ncbi:hypothetical protein ACWGS9_35955, partial [Bradyrhizobium sp. Arg314]
LDLGAYVPGFVHGDQRAEENLMRGMHWNGVLPSPARPQTSITIDGVPYAALLGQSGRQNDILLYRQW